MRSDRIHPVDKISIEVWMTRSTAIKVFLVGFAGGVVGISFWLSLMYLVGIVRIGISV